MEIPKIVYHGTFWPESRGGYPKVLETDFGYVSATPDRRWAWYFATNARWRHREEAGSLLILEIDTDKLPPEVRQGCASPRQLDTRSGHLDDEEWRQDRIKVQEWRFPYVPLEAVTKIEEERRGAQPKMSLLDFRPPR